MESTIQFTNEYLQYLVVIISGLGMLGGAALVFRHLRFRNDGIGPSSLKALGIVFFIPMILILAATTQFSSATLATLLGTIAGYVLSREDQKPREDPKKIAPSAKS